MPLDRVIKTLREHIQDRNIGFVFPSEIAASRWARKTCTLGIARSVEAGRFLAWDRFKEDLIRERDDGREPVSLPARKLFAEAFIRKNAEAAADSPEPGRGAPHFPLKILIPPEHAAGGSVFASWLARILPSLALWEKLMKNAQGPAPDPEDEDYALLKKEYGGFLNQHNMFEPSWEEAKVREGKTRYVIFFPELIEDFDDYDSLLEAPRFVRITAESAESPAQGGESLMLFRSAREEIRSAVTEIRRLHGEEGLPYEDMALSVPELEEMEPVLLKEFALHHVPVTRRAGRKLGEEGAGRLFSLISECASAGFSFSSLKALLLNDRIPWRDAEKNKALVRFGIKYNCVSGYEENGEIRDIWEEAFREGYSDGGKELRPHYRELKKRVSALAESKNFKDIRKHYFTMRGGILPGGASPDDDSRSGLLDMEKITEEDDAILSRCIEELGTLIDLEEKLNDPRLVPASPFHFFLACLGEKEYVKARQKPGVNIFKWRVAAASPFACHFVLNASQNAAQVIYQPMKFLRRDKRKALGLEDRDASGAFFLLCGTDRDSDYRCRTRISASSQTFSGWAIPHCYFAQGKTAAAPPCPDDPYGEERRFWKEGSALKRIYPLQKDSFSRWKSALALKGNSYSFFDSPLPAEDTGVNSVWRLLSASIPGKDGYITVTPTRDLNVFYKCPLSWLYARIFGAAEFSLEASLLDDTSLGLLYHVILEELFAKIRDADGSFKSANLDAYKHWALEITASAIREHPAFRGPLAVPLVSSQAAGMSKKIAALLEMEARLHDGYKVAELELPVSIKTGDIIIRGTIDRVSLSPGGEPVIVDYKTSKLPDQINREELEESALREFQMPLYIKLYEEKTGAATGDAPKVGRAFFYSITGARAKCVVGEEARKGSQTLGREEYAPFLLAAEKQIDEFATKVKSLNFVPPKIKFAFCLECEFKTACRSTYFLNSK